MSIPNVPATTEHMFRRPVSTRSPRELLAPDTDMGAITLRVADLDLMTGYYRDSVGLEVLTDEAAVAHHTARVVLGRRGVPIVVLEPSPELRHAGDHQAGLYHTAILFEQKQDLAAAVYSVASRFPNSFTGSSDHLVSMAFYFDDPEGNGVELYWDRPRSQWDWTTGVPKIGGIALDPNQFLRENLEEDAVAQRTNRAAKIGHIHLSVGDVPTARDFYVRTLGFEVIADLGTALFVSAGGYHHHMAMNTWQSRGSGPRQLTLGLGLVRIDVPTSNDLDELSGRLGRNAVSLRHDGETLRFSDPWANEIEVRATAS